MAACAGGGITGPDPAPGFGRVSAVIDAPGKLPSLALGEDVPVTLRNDSRDTVVVGALACVAELERYLERSDSWQRLQSLRDCISLAILVPAGGRFSFATPGPDAAGRYRVVFDAYLKSGESMSVKSNSFEVR
jgi:hypothetical protein